MLTTAALLGLSACAGTVHSFITPEQAVIAAAARPTAGAFRFVVRATGRQDFLLYLNAQPDYRDQRNLSVEVPPAVELELGQRFGADVPTFLRGRTIVVRGIARRVAIDFTAGGRPTGKYYYQTHVRLEEADDLSLTR